MTEKELKRIEDAVAKSIQTNVNGKIDKMNTKLDEHIEKVAIHNEIHEADMAQIRPFLEGAAGLKVLRDFFVWVGGAAIAWIAIKNNLKL